MIQEETVALEKKLTNLREKHRALNQAIDQLSQSQFSDQLQLMRLKKEKLSLRDMISAIEEELYPDIIA
jgi:hypothetical protein